ncbi:50S ribosome-binding GTPase [Cognatiyoonia koreensis]|uniref:50S ribosome-binding GTPase n=1 Tax=Cognatiyoonia koreensis TaxID=364200 RepID=A0A1I0RMG3_9RHOB|nr:dynamin family protein [Cognatiyoonia koreensis]SEW42203.1 50S ribosome-binding GTPase [Cognatiyoonia koreensis]
MTDKIETPRKPRIALMGEFSAGKSTLSNLLLGARPLPEKVTATRLSPVWMAQGTDTPYRIDMDGGIELVSVERLEGIPVEETRVIRLFFESDILEVCDLIDFPGISDPNMSSDVIERMLEEIDAVLWCTHATQAWRQSESAMWERFPEAVKARSTLLITRFDKLTNDKDKARVLRRVMKETEGQFGGTFPISLTQALAAGEDYDKWEKSGAAAFTEHLITSVQELTQTVAMMDETLYVARPPVELADVPEINSDADAEPFMLENPVIDGDPNATVVLPRRVQAADRVERERPVRDPDAMDHPSQRLGRSSAMTADRCDVAADDYDLTLNEETPTQIAS